MGTGMTSQLATLTVWVVAASAGALVAHLQHVTLGQALRATVANALLFALVAAGILWR